ncbi:DUF3656 domain-containing U32 family peptidase [Desulfofundulus thermosubterraneus]|uniref:Putative protease n=1 Tax=Desulfofundulus thermosubterraneus DSM 16057 TaxID=1121432 RepID=A0A1M6F5E0_9FIRM|nr:DUF3656 domain-containing protein [Desulfofundulus thermosubterraneus]SHI92928.1 putative protease [Desulfofundulus thermosubterraneus DSM 16057]
MTRSAKPELLAPAGDWEGLVAAVQNGADAVYLGGKLYNARQGAANFDHEELQRAVDYAHIRGVKVYVTVNILLSDEELEDAARFLHFLQRAGADGVIVQDLGLATLARHVLPELPLHASTQMTVHNRAGVEKLLALGFRRVVLAREMSLKEIRDIKEATGADLEVFIHGALCICYSGQCLLSSMIGGRSGNRGRCAQPCRLRYTLVDEKGRPVVDPREVGEYLLSPRDLNLSGHLPDLIRAGINSFKIEGRMKRPEYVATVVRIYRNLIDRAMADEDFYITPEEARDLAQIFNRDFTTGYFYERPGYELMSYKRPNNRGLFLGRVVRYHSRTGRAEVALEEPLRVGDGVEVWVSRGGRVGVEVHAIWEEGRQVEQVPAGRVVEIYLPREVRPQDRLFKTHDSSLMERARATFASLREVRKNPVVFHVRVRLGEPVRVRVEDSAGHSGVGTGLTPAQPAVKRPLTPEFLKGQLDRLGNSPFALKDLRCDLDDNVIVPVGEINEARRRAIEELEAARIKSARPAPPIPEDVFARRLAEARVKAAGRVLPTGRSPGKRPLLSIAVTDLASLEAAVFAGVDQVYFGGESFRSGPPVGEEEIRRGTEICKKHGVRFILSTPRIIHDPEMAAVERLLDLAANLPAQGVLAGNLGLIDRVARTGLPLYADLAFNVFNLRTAAYLLDQGAVQLALSPELTMEQVAALVARGHFAAEVLVQGAVELMVSRYCALGSLLGGLAAGRNCAGPCQGRHRALQDRVGAVFPLEVDQFCRMHLFNSRDLCLVDDVHKFAEMGVAALRIDARGRGAEYARAAVQAYRRALDLNPAGNAGELSRLRERLQQYSPAGLTRGHYYRGVE